MGCPFGCSNGSMVEASVAGSTALICPSCLGVSISGEVFLDPRGSQGLSNAVRTAVLRVRDEGGCDPLTRVLSDTAFFRAFRRLVEEARHRHFVSIALIRWDDAEKVYGTLGSHAGDHILKNIATRVKFGVREGDEVGRVGSFVFALALRGADEAAARALAQRVAEGASQEYHPGYIPLLAFSVAAADGLTREEAIEKANQEWIECREA